MEMRRTFMDDGALTFIVQLNRKDNFKISTIYDTRCGSEYFEFFSTHLHEVVEKSEGHRGIARINRLLFS